MPRRDVRFSSLADVKSDVLNLQANGYTQTGSWDLSQIANHLSDWISFPMDGFPKMPFPIKILIGIMRVTQGKSLYKKFVLNQRMSNGQPTMPQTVHSPADPGKSVERLVSMLDRLAAYRGPIHPSPLFGELSYDEMVALQLAHSAHHLSFLSEATK
jgi:hypothetical protein